MCMLGVVEEGNEWGKAYFQMHFKDIFEGWPLANKQWEKSDWFEREVCKGTLCFNAGWVFGFAH